MSTAQPANPNLQQTASKVETFIQEAKRRGTYGAAQDSMISTWSTVLQNVLPTVQLDPAKVTIAELQKRLPDDLKTYGSRKDVKPSTVKTYEIKALRLLGDFEKYWGATDSQWYDWKESVEKRSTQAAAAATARHTSKKPKETPPAPKNGTDVAPPDTDTAGSKYVFKLPQNRTAHLYVPADLTAADVEAMTRQFTPLAAYLSSQFDEPK